MAELFLSVVEHLLNCQRWENKSVESTSKADKVDRFRELKKLLTDFETNNNCFGEAQSKDLVCEAKKLAADTKKFCQKQEAGMSDKWFFDSLIQEHKRMIAKLEAKNRRLEVELEAIHRRLEEQIALRDALRREKMICASKVETDEKAVEYFIEQLDANANVKSEVDIWTVNFSELESFLEQLDANVKSQVDCSDFKILEEDIGKDLRMVGRFNVPLCLAPISKRIYDFFGDISSESSQSDCAAMPSYFLFCAAIKEMDDLKLEQVTETKMLLWRDAINSALNVQFKVGFAKKHLKKIARAYFGLKAMEEKNNEELKNIDGRVREIEVPEDCIREAIYFRGKPLSTGLFHYSA